MVLYTIKNLFSVKDILKALPSSGINNYIETQRDNVLEKQQWRNFTKMQKDKTVLRKCSSNVVFVEPSLV